MRTLCFGLAVALVSIASFAVGDDAGQNLTPAKTRTVSGHQIVHYKNGAVPADLSSVAIAALIPSGSSYTVIGGSGTSSGTFSIADVPSGFYLLQVGSNYLWTSETKLDLDSYANYRSTIVAADASTTVTFDLSNLNAWQSTDVFEMVCPDNLSYEYYPGSVGETIFTGTFNYSDYVIGNLSDKTLGDQYYIAQLATQNVGGYPFTALARFLKPKKFTQAQGSDTNFDGTLETIAQTNEFEANVNGADLQAQALAANPSATLLAGSGFALDVYPGNFAHGQTTDTPDLVLYQGPTISTNGDIGPVSYGNPYSSKFPLYAAYDYLAQTNYTAPGASSSASIVTYAFGYTTNLPSTNSPITPLVDVVNIPSINGLNFFGNQTGVGINPVLAWSPPNVGPPTYYVVNISQLSDSGGNSLLTSIATLDTANTSLTVPPGLLITGQAYVFEITAYYIPGLNFAKTPYVLGPTTALAQVTSGIMQP